MRVDVDVVHQQHVDMIESEAIKARLEGAHHTAVRIIVMKRAARRVDKADLRHILRPASLEDTADLGRDHHLVARIIGKRTAEPLLGKAKAILWGGVEEADASLPSRVDGRFCRRIGNGGVEVAERRRTEPEQGDFGRRGTIVQTEPLHQATPVCVRPINKYATSECKTIPPNVFSSI